MYNKITITNLTKSYEGKKPLFKGINITVEDNEFIFITGKSGTGKSTLLKIIHRIEQPDNGTITIGDKVNYKKIPIHIFRRSIGFVFQDYKLLYDRTAAENIRLPLYIAGKTAPQHMQKALEQIAETCNITHLLDQKVISLSGGEKQLVALARAAINRPKIILADEPTANLDPQASEKVLTLLDSFHHNGITVVVTTHDISLLQSKKGRILLIRNSDIVEIDISGD